MTWISPLKDLLFGPKREVRELIPEIEEKLLVADVGVATTSFLIDSLEKAGLKRGEEVYEFLKRKVEEILGCHPESAGLLGGRRILLDHSGDSSPAAQNDRPFVFFFVGVNGVGKTTTIGKLAYLLSKKTPTLSLTLPPSFDTAQDKRGGGDHGKGLKVMLVAADTFRAAARDQLKIWADRSQSEFVFGADNADPASVVFDGCVAAKARQCDVVLIDTAGRLQTKTSLMEELKKMVRVAEKALSRPAGAAGPAGAARPPDEILLVLDATTGQNGLSQARVFLNAVPLTGLVLTKYDSTAKGGILISVVRETGLPLRFVGVGEKIEDLKPFDAHEFVSSVFA